MPPAGIEPALRLQARRLDLAGWGERFARLYGETVSFLKHSGTPVPLMDILIAASAKEHGLAVITRHVSRFRRIPMLSVMEY